MNAHPLWMLASAGVDAEFSEDESKHSPRGSFLQMGLTPGSGSLEALHSTGPLRTPGGGVQGLLRASACRGHGLLCLPRGGHG